MLAGPSVIKLITAIIMIVIITLAGLSGLVSCLRARPGAYSRVDHMKAASVW